LRRALAVTASVAALTAGASLPASASVGGPHMVAAITSVDGCSVVHPHFCGTEQDTINGQLLSVVGNPQRPASSATPWFGPQQGVARSTSWLITHPIAYGPDNGALFHWSNAGRDLFGDYLACSANGSLTLTNTISARGGNTEWVYDGTGFTCMGRYLRLAPTGGVIGSATTSANPADESPTVFVDADA
jgi:hypothetical protein